MPGRQNRSPMISLSCGNALTRLGREEGLRYFQQALDTCLANHLYANAASSSTNIAQMIYNAGDHESGEDVIE